MKTLNEESVMLEIVSVDSFMPEQVSRDLSHLIALELSQGCGMKQVRLLLGTERMKSSSLANGLSSLI